MPARERSNAIVFLSSAVEKEIFGILKPVAERFLSADNIPAEMNGAERNEFAREVLEHMKEATAKYFSTALSKLESYGAPQFVNEMRGMKTSQEFKK